MSKEEFEKEAEEACSKYFEENCHKKNKWADTYDLVAMWQDGYNKANEWHYVKDGDLPKVNQECYFIHSNTYGAGNKPIFTKSSIQVHAGTYTYALDEEGNETTDFCFYDDFIQEEMDINEVYTWKAIVLPELPKEIEENGNSEV